MGMNLETEIFTGIVAAMRLRAGSRTWEDRRSLGRIPMQKCIAIIPYKQGESGEAVNVWVRDLSAGGIGLVHSHPMEAGEQFVVRLPKMDGTDVPVVCVVTHSASLSPDLFTIGARFDAVLSNAVLQSNSSAAA